MPTTPPFTLDLPDPTESVNPDYVAQNEVEEVLAQVKTQVDTRYNDNIVVLNTKTSRFDDHQETVLNYAVYLSFAGKNYYSDRLMELVSKNPGGGLPVEITAFSGPPEFSLKRAGGGSLQRADQSPRMIARMRSRLV